MYLEQTGKSNIFKEPFNAGLYVTYVNNLRNKPKKYQVISSSF